MPIPNVRNGRESPRFVEVQGIIMTGDGYYLTLSVVVWGGGSVRLRAWYRFWARHLRSGLYHTRGVPSRFLNP